MSKKNTKLKSSNFKNIITPKSRFNEQARKTALFIKSCNFTKSRDGINKNVYLGSWHLFTKSWDSLNRASLNRNLGPLSKEIRSLCLMKCFKLFHTFGLWKHFSFLATLLLNLWMWSKSTFTYYVPGKIGQNENQTINLIGVFVFQKYPWSRAFYQAWNSYIWSVRSK